MWLFTLPPPLVFCSLPPNPPRFSWYSYATHVSYFYNPFALSGEWLINHKIFNDWFRIPVFAFHLFSDLSRWLYWQDGWPTMFVVQEIVDLPGAFQTSAGGLLLTVPLSAPLFSFHPPRMLPPSNRSSVCPTLLFLTTSCSCDRTLSTWPSSCSTSSNLPAWSRDWNFYLFIRFGSIGCWRTDLAGLCRVFN